MGCVKRGGSGDGWSRERTQKGFPTHGGSSCPWGVSREVGKGFLTHGGSSCPWGVSRRVGKGFPTHGVCQVKKKAPTVVERLGLFLG